MVLIMSREMDITTSDVIGWLLYYEIPFIRINKNTKVTVQSFSINNREDDIDFTLVIENPNYEPQSIKSSEITGFWYRRGKLQMEYPTIDENTLEDEDYKAFAKRLNYYLDLESKTVTNSIYSHLTRRKSINSFLAREANKVDYLIIAKAVGLEIPNTLISNNKEGLRTFLREQPSISKAMFVGGLPSPEFTFGAGTEILTQDDIDQAPFRNFPSCVQEQLDKAYELRIFYLHGQCYPMAIFSQNDEQTKVDFRNYNYTSRNRTPPYKLPKDIETKIHLFMEKVDLNSGSIDIVVTKDKRFVFLEVNPIGQFSQVSYPGNYYLEKKIAQYFKND